MPLTSAQEALAESHGHDGQPCEGSDHSEVRADLAYDAALHGLRFQIRTTGFVARQYGHLEVGESEEQHGTFRYLVTRTAADPTQKDAE